MKKRITAFATALVMLFSVHITGYADSGYTIIPSYNFSITVNGKEISDKTVISPEDRVKIAIDDENAVVVGSNEKFYAVNENFHVTENVDFTDAVIYTSGLEMVNGAQVRVGNVKLEDGKIGQAADSGLRFIAKCDYNGTIIAENVEFGIKVAAEGSDKEVYIPAVVFQDNANSVFTAAITNLAHGNYNRVYEARGYIKVPLADGREKEILTEPVKRSIYQVSAGIMKNSSAEGNDAKPYTVDEAVRGVLNAYINQTGIRLTYSEDRTMRARIDGTGAYTGEVFFDVASSVNEQGGVDVVITPLNEEYGFGNSVTINDWWKEYIRINNNNSVSAKYISNAVLENNVLSFTFTVPEETYEFNQDDYVTIVTAVGDGIISGIKNGEEVSYTVGERIYLFGLAESMDDIVPGSVVMIAAKDGRCVAIELLASLGLPINPAGYEADFGVYDSHGDERYKNVVSEMYSKSGKTLTCKNYPDNTPLKYEFASVSTPCRRVGIAMNGGSVEIIVKTSNIAAYPTIFESTATYHNYVYLRYDNESGKVKECVYYCVPKDVDYTDGGDYSQIFSLPDYTVIIE